MKQLEKNKAYQDAKVAFIRDRMNERGTWPVVNWPESETVDLTEDMVMGETQSSPLMIAIAILAIVALSIVVLGAYGVASAESPFNNSLPPGYQEKQTYNYGQNTRSNTAVQAELAEYLARRNAEAAFGYTPPTQNYGSSSERKSSIIYDALMQKSVNDAVDAKMQRYGR